MTGIKVFGGPFVRGGMNSAQQVVVDTDGGIYVAGTYGGDTDLGDGCTLPGDPTVTDPDRRELFLARLTPDLHCQWAVHTTDQDTDQAFDLQLLPNGGGVVMSGWLGLGFIGQIMGQQGFIVAYSPAGTQLWGLAGSPTESIENAGGLSVASDGHVVWMGSGRNLGSIRGFPTQDGWFVASFAPGGKLEWLNPKFDTVLSVGHGPGGVVEVLGASDRAIDFGNNVMFTPPVPLTKTPYIAMLSAKDGTVTSVAATDFPLTPVGKLQDLYWQNARFLDDGTLLAAIPVDMAATVGGQGIAPTQASIVLARFKPDGTLQTLKGPWAQIVANDIRAGANNALVISGGYYGDTTIDGVMLQGTLPPNPAGVMSDLLVLRTTIPQ
jgi:hypothetical protein